MRQPPPCVPVNAHSWSLVLTRLADPHVYQLMSVVRIVRRMPTQILLLTCVILVPMMAVPHVMTQGA